MPSLFRSSENRYIGKSGTPVSGMRLITDMEDYPEVPRALRFLHVSPSSAIATAAVVRTLKRVRASAGHFLVTSHCRS
jgi:hypothetical protein